MTWDGLFLVGCVFWRGIIWEMVGCGIERESGVEPPQSERLSFVVWRGLTRVVRDGAKISFCE